MWVTLGVTPGPESSQYNRSRCVKNRRTVGRGQSTVLGGSDPTFVGLQPPKSLWGHSRPFVRSARPALAARQKFCHAGCHATCLPNLKNERRKEVAHPESTTQTIEECKPADSYRAGCPTQARQIRRIH